MIERIEPDISRAKSMLEMAERAQRFINQIIEKLGIAGDQSILAREYYEVIRELASAILFIDGFKTTGENAHKEIIDYLNNYPDFSQGEIIAIQDLRIKRNNNSYEGKNR